MKKIFNNILKVALVLTIVFGVFKGFQYYKQSQITNETSYKVKTKKNTKYNGVYSLTKLDEKGNNTWNGLICYVKNDKIISANLVEFESRESIIENKLAGNKNATDMEILNASSLKPKIKIMNAKPTGFGSSISLVSKGVVACMGQIVFFDKDINLEKDYNDIKNCNVLAGFDEESKEIWLSKLLNNEKSEYSKNHKLIHYNDYHDVEKKCAIDDGELISGLNNTFNAGLKDWEDL